MPETQTRYLGFKLCSSSFPSLTMVMVQPLGRLVDFLDSAGEAVQQMLFWSHLDRSGHTILDPPAWCTPFGLTNQFRNKNYFETNQKPFFPRRMARVTQVKSSKALGWSWHVISGPIPSKGCPPPPDPQFFWTLFKKPLTPPLRFEHYVEIFFWWIS